MTCNAVHGEVDDRDGGCTKLKISLLDFLFGLEQTVKMSYAIPIREDAIPIREEAQSESEVYLRLTWRARRQMDEKSYDEILIT